MKRTIGLLGIILGVLVLSLELFLLKMMQLLEKLDGRFYSSLWRYAGEPPCSFALILTLIVLAVSVWTFAAGKKD